MAGNPREHNEDRGFWDGGAPGHTTDGETSGRPSGFPGTRNAKRMGIRTNIDFPAGETDGTNGTNETNETNE